MNKTNQVTQNAPAIGDFIEIPAWRTFGQVIGERDPMLGSENAIDVLVQEHPDQRVDNCRWYRLEPDEFTLCQ